jgi:hypothetical protein
MEAEFEGDGLLMRPKKARLFCASTPVQNEGPGLARNGAHRAAHDGWGWG